MKQSSDESEDFEVRVGMMPIEKAIRLAVMQSLLPGIAIYRDGGKV